MTDDRRSLPPSHQPPEAKLPLFMKLIRGFFILIAGTVLFGFLVFGLCLLAVATSSRR